MHVIVSGKVQGVGFRWATKECAAQLNLTGYVCNKSDGTVEIIAQGSRERLSHLIHQLLERFKLQPENFKITYPSPQEIYSSFVIL